MQFNQIKALLTRYFEGNTTLEEERLLRQYFTVQKEIPPELLTYRSQFLLCNAMAAAKPDTGRLERKIADQIDMQWHAPKPVNHRRTLYRLMVAASLALLTGIASLLFYLQQKPQPEDTYTDPQLAYYEAQKALLYVSRKMNRGIEPLSNVSKITTGTDKLKSLERMDESLGMLNLVSFINKSSNLKK